MLSSLTIRGWPRQVGPADPFPHPFRRAYEDLRLGPGEQPLLLYSPRARFGRSESTSKLLVWAGQRLACLDARRGGVVTTTLALDQVHEVEWGQSLLDAWLRLEAHGPEGRTVVRVEFNAVGLELYKPIADTARSAAYEGMHLSIADPDRRLGPLADQEPRFAGAAAQALLSGIELRRHWLQPRAGRARRGLLRARTPGLLLLVTQAELIVIQEQPTRAGGRYGTVWRCLPLRSILAAGIVLDPVRGLASLHVGLPGDSEVRVAVDPAAVEALRAFLRECDPRWGELESAPVAATTPGHSLEAPPP